MRLASAFALVCLLLCTGSVQAQMPKKCPREAPTGYYKYVNDFANVIDQPTKERLASVLNNLKERADIEFAVVTEPTTGELPIFDYSLATSRCWGIGSKESEKNGLLLVVAVNDRKYFTQVSRHLEGDLPDGLVGEIQRRTLVEPFRSGDYSRGIMDAVQTLVATLGEKRGFSIEGIDQRSAYRPRAERSRDVRSRGGIGFGACCVIAIILLVIFSLFKGGRRGGGRGGWGGGGGLMNALLLANLLSNLGGRGSSGWGSGGGSSSGWGGGDFGGFGGGGDFGGGGAGGSW